MEEHVVSLLEQEFGAVYQTGGTVRDELMGRHTNDIDLLVDAHVDAWTGKRFCKTIEKECGGTAYQLRFEKQQLLRWFPKGSESYLGTSWYLDEHVDIVLMYDHSISENLMARDFSVNALAKRRNIVIDPSGGAMDLTNNILRALDNDGWRVQGTVRAIRGLRFIMSHNFVPDEATENLLKDHLSRIKSAHTKGGWWHDLHKMCQMTDGSEDILRAYGLPNHHIINLMKPLD